MKGKTLLLDSETWDLVLDPAGNIAMVEGNYAIAQNVANAVRLFTKDAYFYTERGIPHFNIELGHKKRISDSVLRARIKRMALGIDGVKTAEVSLEKELEEGRVLGGEVFITTTNGETAFISF